MVVARLVVASLVLASLVGSVARADGTDDSKRRARAMRAYTLTEELALDEATAAKLFPLLARFDAEADKVAARRSDVQLRLRATTAKTERRAIDALVDESLQTTRWQRDLEDRRFGELRKILAPAQIAKILSIDLDNPTMPKLAPARRFTDGLDEIDDDDDAPMPPASTSKKPPVKPGARPCDPFNTRGASCH